jgi:peptide/nickel transport system substrate-binding protein
MRVKGGRELAFTLMIPTISPTRIRMGPLLQEQLRRMGIRVQLEQLEMATEIDREVRGAFDAALDAWTMASSPDGIKGAWSSSGRGKNGINYSSYSSAKFDSLLDAALWSDSTHARENFTNAFALINGDAPAVWLYEARKVIGIHKRFRTGPMRPDAWWFDLANWYVPSGERVERDLIPSRR